MSDQQEAIIFEDLTQVEVPVTLGNVKYILREATGEAAVKYQNAVTKCSRFTDGEFSGIQGDLADTQPLLVSLCLFEAETGKPVSLAKVKSWPYRVQKDLYTRAKLISDLDEKTDKATLEKQLAAIQKQLAELANEGDPSKNQHGAMTDGSN